ncbi:uncharacterized protein Gasu_65480 [Galdieria sulphuraria]|uniref:Uncharacterized protein n=1 Tax=Galdieria sulphuraria TaxID=130081 RepID=M2X7J6_GALSU|nr:uncharacterized protein Gasu_65480 [Galdieria sulphuraria]EME25792.1 hypothetical protein Gasu_65480 [Galdieria sulphuraria]|eukprot:XP_005702312.1 hypothetical protein Gasu_65480 [Galdieria sulphuraria]
MDLLEEFTQVDLADEVPTSTSILSSKYTEDNLVDSLLDKNHNERKSPHSFPDSCKLLSILPRSIETRLNPLFPELTQH